MPQTYLTLDEAAAKLGISPAEMEKLQEQGVIPGFKDRDVWMFLLSDIEGFLKTRGPADVLDDELSDAETVISRHKGQPGAGSDSSPDVLPGPAPVETTATTSVADALSVATPADTDATADADSQVGAVEKEVSQLELPPDAASESPSTGEMEPPALSVGDVELASAVPEGSTLPQPENLLPSNPELADNADAGDLEVGSKSTDVSHAGLMASSSQSDPETPKVETPEVPADAALEDAEVTLMAPVGFGADDLDEVASSASVTDDEEDVRLSTSDSAIDFSSPDSGVRLVGAPGMIDPSESIQDVRLLPGDDGGSGLAFAGASALDDDDSKASDDSGISLTGDSSLGILPAESGILLSGKSGVKHTGSGIILPEGSGIRGKSKPTPPPTPDSILDEDVALRDDGSEISLASDSGISLEAASLDSLSDSGISLDMPSTGDASDSGITLDQIPMLGEELDVPLRGAAEDADVDTYELNLDADLVESSGEVHILDDDGSGSVDILDDGSSDGSSVETLMSDDDAESDDDLDIDDDLIGEDDEVDADLLDADDAFDDEDEDGDYGDRRPAASAILAAPEREMSGMTFGGIAFVSLVMILGCIVSFELARGFMATDGLAGAAPSGGLLDMFSSLFS